MLAINLPERADGYSGRSWIVRMVSGLWPEIAWIIVIRIISLGKVSRIECLSGVWRNGLERGLVGLKMFTALVEQ